MKLLIQGLNFRAGWRDSRAKFRNPVEKIREGGKIPPVKNSQFSRKFCFYGAKLAVSKKFAAFRVKLDNFLVSVGNILLPMGGDIFPMYQELDAIRSENSKLSRGISRILPVFGEITAYLRKRIMG